MAPFVDVKEDFPPDIHCPEDRDLFDFYRRGLESLKTCPLSCLKEAVLEKRFQTTRFVHYDRLCYALCATCSKRLFGHSF